MEDCIVYLVWQLRQAGFVIKFTWPNLLFISWRHTEGDYLLKQNPIIKAMTPSPSKPVPKANSSVGGAPRQKNQQPRGGAKGVGFSDIDYIIHPQEDFSMGLGSGGGGQRSRMVQPGQAGPREASQYQPPASFVQNLERPEPSHQNSYKSAYNGSYSGGGAKESASKINGNVLADLWS